MTRRIDSRHDRIARSVARAYGGQYRRAPAKGADVVSARRAIAVEVEASPKTLSNGIHQLRGYRKERYLAVPDTLVQQAKERTRHLKIGVMNSTGRIVKPARPVGKHRRSVHSSTRK